MEPSIWYAGGAPLLRMAVIVACAFGALATLRRCTHGRALAELTAADLATATALGITLSVAVLSPHIPAVEAVAAMGLLVALHALLGGVDAWRSTRAGRTTTRGPIVTTAGALDGRPRAGRGTPDDVPVAALDELSHVEGMRLAVRDACGSLGAAARRSRGGEPEILIGPSGRPLS